MKHIAFAFLPSGSRPQTLFIKQVFVKGQLRGVNGRWVFHSEWRKKEKCNRYMGKSWLADFPRQHSFYSFKLLALHITGLVQAPIWHINLFLITNLKGGDEISCFGIQILSSQGAALPFVPFARQMQHCRMLPQRALPKGKTYRVGVQGVLALAQFGIFRIDLNDGT